MLQDSAIKDLICQTEQGCRELICQLKRKESGTIKRIIIGLKMLFHLAKFREKDPLEEQQKHFLTSKSKKILITIK